MHEGASAVRHVPLEGDPYLCLVGNHFKHSSRENAVGPELLPVLQPSISNYTHFERHHGVFVRDLGLLGEREGMEEVH